MDEATYVWAVNYEIILMMKTRLILLLLVCVSYATSAQQLDSKNIASLGRIYLQGCWKGRDKTKEDIGRSLLILPIIATLEGDHLSVVFDDLVSDALIAISKDGHAVYSLNCMFDVSHGCTIPMNGFHPVFTYWNSRIRMRE